MRTSRRCVISVIGILVAVATSSCDRCPPYVIADTGVVKCIVTKKDFGSITEILVQNHLAENTYQELLVFDPVQRLNDRQALLFAANPIFGEGGLRETWIGVNGKWETVVFNVRHPDGGKCFLVLQNPPYPIQVGSMTQFSSIMTTNPSVVLHRLAVTEEQAAKSQQSTNEMTY